MGRVSGRSITCVDWVADMPTSDASARTIIIETITFKGTSGFMVGNCVAVETIVKQSHGYV